MQAIKSALDIGPETEFGRRIIQAAYNAVLNERKAKETENHEKQKRN